MADKPKPASKRKGRATRNIPDTLLPKKDPSNPKSRRRPNPLPVEAAKAPTGRPPQYKPEYDILAYRLALLGLDDAEIASGIGMTIEGIKFWDRTQPSFRTARAQGRIEADGRVAHAFYSRALGYSHPEEKVFLGPGGQVVVHETTRHYPPDTQAGALWLANRQRNRWSLKPGDPALDATSPGDGEVKITGGLPEDE